MRIGPMMYGAALIAAGLSATPALAQDAPPADAPAATETKADAGQNVAKPAEDAEEPTKPFTFELGLAGVSDYRFRGISLSDKDPAFQPSFTVSHQSGFYASVWGSNVAENDGDDIEVDLIGGFATTVNDFDLDVNATYYVYPGAKELNYVEFIGTLSHAVGPATVGGTFAFTPKQDDAAPKRGIYYAINGELPLGKSGISLTASYGIEDNAFYRHKRDWSLGVSGEVLGFSLGAAYVDTAHTGGDPLGKAGVVVSISRAFEF
ncbi:MAG: TorF family putative porin [Sphingomicrobium sp.]